MLMVLSVTSLDSAAGDLHMHPFSPFELVLLPIQ